MPEIKEIVGNASLFGFLVLCAVVSLRVIPQWLSHRKELRMAELGVRKEEAAARLVGAESIGKLTETLRSANEVTGELKLFLRAVMREHEIVRQAQTELSARMDALERAQGTSMRH